jgi:hypothetical protein
MIARIGLIRQYTKFDRAAGRVDTIVFGRSTGFGGTELPIFIPTTFRVENAVANLALEYDDLDASAIYSFGNDLNALEIKVSYPSTGNGFFLDYFQKDPNAESRLVAQWFAISSLYLVSQL